MRVHAPYRKFTAEFRQDAVALMQGRDCSYRQLEKDLGVNQNTLRAWYKADEMAKKKDKRRGQESAASRLPAGETPRQKLDRLEGENKRLLKQVEQLEEDRAILKKAAAFFARENG
jgi:transposase